MSTAPVDPSACVLLTGATGFLGKVVLADLLRRRSALGLGKIFVVVRKKSGMPPEQRFEQMANSPCFKGLGHAWKQHVVMVAASLGQPRCALAADDWDMLVREVTHVIHCAASVDFDLPLRDASEANIISSLNVLELARSCTGLRRMVSVSTAYTTPRRPGPLGEELAKLPKPAAEIFAAIRDGSANKDEVLKSTGHPNTYTLTKCIAEHLLWERREHVPLSIVRPSVISASWRFPHPGWIDSTAALAGLVCAIGAGLLRVVDGDYGTFLDVVPVDEVSRRILDQAFADGGADARIVYAVAGLDNSYTIDEWVSHIETYFNRHPVQMRASMRYLGPRNRDYEVRRFLHHQLPSLVMQGIYAAQDNHTMRRRARRLVQKLDLINRVFPYFTNNTFDFRPSSPLPHEFDVQEYVPLVCEGVSRHLLAKDPTQVVLTGKGAKSPRSDLAWSMTRPRGNLAIRLSATVLTKALRRMFDEVTFDQKSFEQARRLAGDDTAWVFVPSHRSYMDFLVCSYLFFARPGLGFSVPHIAAAQEFAHVRLVGWLFKQMHAFYLRRGMGQADPSLNRRVHQLLNQGHSLEFFIEGQRSRSRRFLAPRRGLLRCLQASKRRLVLVPVSISYDRVPEEATFLRELKGYPKDPMRLPDLLRWARRMLDHGVRLGRMHIQCGTPLPLDADVDVHAISREIMAGLQRSTVVSTFHLRCFVQAHPHLGIDVPWLQAAIERRGGRVLASSLPSPEETMDLDLERSLCNQWMHWFLREVAAARPHNAALAHYQAENCFGEQEAISADEPGDEERLRALLAELFQPVCADYQAVAQSAKQLAGRVGQQIRIEQLLHQANYRDHTTACSALQAMQDHGLLAAVDGGHVRIMARAPQFAAFAEQCVWHMTVAPGAQVVTA